MRALTRIVVAAAAAVAAGAGAAGCGGGVDLSGGWQVTAHTVNDTACDAPGPAVADPPYIRFERDSLFGQKYYQWGPCTDATEASCDSGGGLFGLLYAKEIDNGWQAEIYVASGAAGDCLLSATVSTAVVEEEVLSIETRRSELDHANTPCESADEAMMQMPCVGLEMMTGVRVGM